MSFDILVRYFPCHGGICSLFSCAYRFLNMAPLMLCRNMHMIVEHHYPFDRFGRTPCALLSPARSKSSHNSEEEKE
jgi:hypothetical protein